LSLKNKIDVHIEHYLPMQVEWIQGWMRAEKSINIKFTEFKELKEEPLTLIQSILKFYDIDVSDDSILLHETTTDVNHFRKGMTNEWQEIFTAEQITKASSLIPDELKVKFNWID
jgi:hypothetical protein